ncbi:hypothetical protein [Chelatococcus reniformis]|uniref:Uncharacterized protein n=1 Tax=Chelatococcus reniformis TaxID=1494448 RepID=A0A916UZL9_9HYPH|nr:hypothetical protein [Chelatococcus reniformis]GGC94685.1 hypothetical protein GCM10010994_60540 [Chelatococcus reniformis]
MTIHTKIAPAVGSAGELNLRDLTHRFGDEPRVYDLLLAFRLGFADPHKIRTLIRRNIVELESYGQVSATAAETSRKGGRPGKAYYLNEGQALVICALSRTATAAQVRRQLIVVFMTYRQMAGGISFGLAGDERRALRDICDLGHIVAHDGFRYLWVPLSRTMEDVLAAFDADRTELEWNHGTEPLDPLGQPDIRFDEAEPDACAELTWPEVGPGAMPSARFDSNDDDEESGDEREPSLGAPEVHPINTIGMRDMEPIVDRRASQERWAAGGRRDLEADPLDAGEVEHDGRELSWPESAGRGPLDHLSGTDDDELGDTGIGDEEAIGEQAQRHLDAGGTILGSSDAPIGPRH